MISICCRIASCADVRNNWIPHYCIDKIYLTNSFFEVIKFYKLFSILFVNRKSVWLDKGVDNDRLPYQLIKLTYQLQYKMSIYSFVEFSFCSVILRLVTYEFQPYITGLLQMFISHGIYPSANSGKIYGSNSVRLMWALNNLPWYFSQENLRWQLSFWSTPLYM